MTRRQMIAIVGLWLLFMVRIWPIRLAGFVYEDATWNLHARPFFGPRGLMSGLWWLQLRLGHSALAFHEVSIALFLGVVFALAWLLRRLDHSPDTILIACGLVLLHPLTTEPLAYSAGRSDLIAALGVLSACALAASPVWYRPMRLLGIIAALALGFGGKETAIVGLPLVGLTIWRLNVWRRAPAMLRDAVAVCVAIAFGWFVLHEAVSVPFSMLGESPGVASSAWHWITVQAVATCAHVGQLILPIGISPVPDYDHLGAGAGLSVGAVCLWIVATCAICAADAAYAAYADAPPPPTSRWLAYGPLWMLAVLAPRFYVRTPRSPLNDHQFLLVLIGAAVTLAAFIDDFRRWRQETP